MRPRQRPGETHSSARLSALKWGKQVMERSRFGSASNCMSPSHSLSILARSARIDRPAFENCFSRKSSHTCSTGLPFRAVGRLRDQTDVLGDLEFFGVLMSALGAKLPGQVHEIGRHDLKCRIRGEIWYVVWAMLQ